MPKAGDKKSSDLFSQTPSTPEIPIAELPRKRTERQKYIILYYHPPTFRCMRDPLQFRVCAFSRAQARTALVRAAKYKGTLPSLNQNDYAAVPEELFKRHREELSRLSNVESADSLVRVLMENDILKEEREASRKAAIAERERELKNCPIPDEP